MEFARSVFAVLGDLAARPLAPFVDGATIVYWPYLLAAAALTLGLAMVAGLGTSGGAKTFLHDAFCKKVWWSPSSRADYFYYLINIIVFPILFAPAILAQSAVGGEVSAVLTTIFGAWPEPLFSEAALRIAYTVLFFVAYDFGRYAAHWSLHTYPVLWEFHKTHHSAETLTPITSFRQHPVELIVMGLGGNLMGGLATGG
ncbi:MAG: sterol desaturase family protein, partial [Proteobacteria bacterium]|nr:sterol desaturase family protein [Pseudomonadota bacterium]